MAMRNGKSTIDVNERTIDLVVVDFFVHRHVSICRATDGTKISNRNVSIR